MTKQKERLIQIAGSGLIATFVLATGYAKNECVKRYGTNAEECIFFPEEFIAYHAKNKTNTP